MVDSGRLAQLSVVVGILAVGMASCVPDSKEGRPSEGRERTHEGEDVV